MEDKVAILGGGPSGLAMGSLWASHGYRVNVWVRDVDRLACICPPEGITVVGEQVTTFSPSLVSSDLAEVLEGVKIAIVCTPGAGHDFIACELQSLAADLIDDLLILLSPGRCFGALNFKARLGSARDLINIAEASTELHASRIAGGKLHVYAIKKIVAVGAESRDVAERIVRSFPASIGSHYTIQDSWLPVTLSNIGYVLHCIPALQADLGLKGRYFYTEVIDREMAERLVELDKERMITARAIGHEVPNICQWLHQTYGTPMANLYEMLNATDAYAEIPSPETVTHRYITDDVPTGLVPLEAMATSAGLAVPLTSGLIDQANSKLNRDFRSSGRGLPADWRVQ